MSKNKFNIQGKLNVAVKTAKGRKSSSTAWLNRHFNDKFVNMAQKEGFLSRAAYKLIEINDKFSILSKARNILDLGASPGGWSQVIIRHANTKKFLAMDLLDIGISDANLNFLKGDFNSPEIQDQIVTFFAGEKIDLIVSDMAPNFIGHKQTDSLRSVALCEEVLLFCQDNLALGGNLVIKAFKGMGEVALLSEVKKSFTKVSCFKPEASRKESSEYYIIATNFIGDASNEE